MSGHVSQGILLATDCSPYYFSPALATPRCQCQEPVPLISPQDPAAELSQEEINTHLDASGFAPLANGQDEL